MTVTLVDLTDGAGAGVNVYCFPPAGGGVSPWRRWAGEAPPGIALRAVVYPREAAARRSIRELAVRAVDRLPVRAGVTVLLGHSMGALVAFEAIREMRRRGRPEPSCLVVAAERAPHLPPTQRLHTLPTAQFWDEVSRLGNTPAELLADHGMRQHAEAGLRADFAACETYEYRPEPPLACRIVALAGSDDREVGTDQVAAWRMHTLGTFAFHEREGGHFFLYSHFDTVLRELGVPDPAGRTPAWSR